MDNETDGELSNNPSLGNQQGTGGVTDLIDTEGVDNLEDTGGVMNPGVAGNTHRTNTNTPVRP